MPRAMLRRRSLMAAAIGGGAAWLIGCVPRLAARRGRARSPGSLDALAALCAELSHAAAIGQACLWALPATETSKACLTRAILADLRSSGTARSSAVALAQVLRERSREDFRNGRMVIVGGWMFSLTETRLYALVALRLEPQATPRAIDGYPALAACRTGLCG